MNAQLTTHQLADGPVPDPHVCDLKRVELGSRVTFHFDTGCGRFFSTEQIHWVRSWKHCPYCGKEIRRLN